MDYPISDTSARLLNGKFTDGDPVGGIPASRDSADYQNMVFDELINLIVAAGLTPNEGSLSQVLEAIQAIAAAKNHSHSQYAVSGHTHANVDAEKLSGKSGSSYALRDAANQYFSGSHEFHGTDANNNYTEAPIEIREVGLVTTSQSGEAYAPKLAFHWGGIAQSSIILDSAGALKITDGTGGKKILHEGNTSVVVASCTFRGSDGYVFSGKGISSIQVLGAGQYRIHFATAMPSENYTVVGNPSGIGVGTSLHVSNATTTHCDIISYYGGDNTAGVFNPTRFDFAIIQN